MNFKQIVLDKEALVRIGLRSLCSFAKNHMLLVCDTLLYECVTAESTPHRRLLDECTRLINAGAYYCSCSFTFVKWEGRNMRPYPTFLPDLKKTTRIQKGDVRLEDSFTPQERKGMLDLQTGIAKNILIGTAENVGLRINSERPDIATNIRTLPRNAHSRMMQWLEGLDRVGMHDVAVRSMQEEWLEDDAKFCLSQEWISWQYFRLASVLAKEYCYLSQMGGVPGGVRAEHDYQDMDYVLLLSRADGLLTRDEKLVKPLAQAAFPDKHIFSNLDEVPEEYVCHWD